LHQEEESMGYITLHTGGIDGMWKNPKVQCQVLGAHAKWNCKSSVASRNWNLAVVMAPWKLKRTNYMSLTDHAKRLWQK
jgi:hypothetical protein